MRGIIINNNEIYIYINIYIYLFSVCLYICRTVCRRHTEAEVGAAVPGQQCGAATAAPPPKGDLTSRESLGSFGCR